MTKPKLQISTFKFPAVFIFIILPFSLTFVAASPGNGRISGTVTSAETGQVLPGTNILLEGTLLGAAADLDGRFYINDVPPGDYRLNVLNIGFQSQDIPVIVRPDSTLDLTVQLTPKSIRSPEIVVTGARRTTRKVDSPVTIATLSEAEIAFRNPVTAADALPYESGVQLLDGQISMRGSSGYARGAGSRVIVLVDGFPAMSYDNGTIYWDAVPARNIQRIEILKGPGSALYGSAAMGGVVNIITKPIAEGRDSHVSFGGGIYSKPADERQVWSQKSMLLEEWRAGHSRHFGPLAVALSLGRSNSAGYRENGWYERDFLNGEIEWALAPHRALQSRFFYVRDEHGSFTEWKSPFQPYHTPVNTRDDQIRTHKLQWSSQYSRIVSPSRSHLLRLNVFNTRFDNELYNNRSYSQARTLNPELQINLRPGQRHYLSSGLDLKFHRVEADIWGDHRAEEAAVYLQDELSLGRSLKITLGGRWDVSRIDEGDFRNQLNPKLGVNLDISPSLVLRGSLGRGYRAPSMAELFIDSRQYIFEVKPNPDLQPETSTAAELGFYWQGRIFNLDMALFRSNYADLIEPILDPADQKIQFRNVTEARIQGLELSLDWFWPWLEATGRLAYTYLDPRDLTADDVLAYRHRHSLVLSEQLVLSHLWVIGMDYRYLSRMERVQLYEENPVTGADQRVPIKLLSVFCRYAVDDDLKVHLSVENLLAYRYVVIERNMGPPRLVKLRVDYHF